MRRKLALLYSLVVISALAQSPTVTNISFDSISHSDFRMTFDSTGSWSYLRVRYIPSPGTCTSGTGGIVQGNTSVQNINFGATIVVAGLLPNTTYQVCPELSANNVNWSSGFGASITTLPLPAVHPAPPIAPTTFDTSYPDTTGYNSVTVASDCSDFMSQVNAAISNQANQGTIINLSPGTVCNGTYFLTQQPPDVVSFQSSAVNTSANTITLPSHGYPEGQGIILATNYGCLPGSLSAGSNNCRFQGPIMPGQLYYAHVVDANTIQVYDKAPKSQGGTLCVLPDGGAGREMIVKWPRPLKWIIIRTSVPDSQFAPIDTRIGPDWESKMPVIQLPLSHIGGNYAPNTALGFSDSDNNNQILTANIRVVGVKFTYEKNPYSSTSSDPMPWYQLWSTVPTNQNIFCDRCYFHGLGTPDRVYKAINWDGKNVAFLNSYFDNLTYFHAAYTGLGVSQKSSTAFTIDPGKHAFGAGHGSLDNTATVQLSGTNPGQARIFAYFTMTGNQLNVALPPGLTGTCAGVSNCHIFTNSSVGSGIAMAGTSGTYPGDSGGLDSYYVDPVFSTSPDGSNSVSVFSDLTSPNAPSAAWADYQLGTRFTSDTNGYITGGRFMKVPGDPANSHRMYLCSNDGVQLATAVSTSETANGWQTVQFSTPVPITANTVYIISWQTSFFYYVNRYFVSITHDKGPLHTPGVYEPTNGSCNHTDTWPKDTQGRPAAGEVACIDVANGSIVGVANADAQSSAFITEGCQCMIGGIGPGPYAAINNYISGAGNLWHHDDSGLTWATRGDYTYTRNTFNVPLWSQWLGPQSDGMHYLHRQTLEWKSGQRISLKGNIFDGNYIDVAPAAIAIAFSSRNGQGITDVDVNLNEFKHGPGIVQTAQSVETSASPQTPPANRFRFTNNLMWDIDGNKYYVPAMQLPGTGWIFEGPLASEDVTIDHNTVVGNNGRNPTIMHLFDTKIEGVQVTNNIFSIDSFSTGLNIDGSIMNSGCDSGLTGQAAADCMLTNSLWHHNVFIPNAASGATPGMVQNWWPGYTGTNYFSLDTDLSKIGWNSYKSTDGSGDFYFRSNYCSGCGKGASDLKDVGVDMNSLKSATGEVVHTGVNNVTSSSANINFVAPDAQACPIDVSSTDPKVVTSFTRVSDSGGAKIRNVTLSGLSSRTVYYYRINCAVQQPTGKFITH